MPVNLKSLDPVLAEQLDDIGNQIAAERHADIEQARAEVLEMVDVTGERLYEVPDVKVIDTHTYEDDFKPPTPKLRMRDSEGHLITAPRGAEVQRTLTGELMLVTPPNKIPPPPVVDVKALEKRKQRQIQFRQKDQQYLDRLSNAFIEELGNVEELKVALATSGNAKAEKFLADLANPKYIKRKWTVSAIAHVNGLSPVDLATIWRNYNLSKGTLKAIGAIPQIIDHVVEDAKSTVKVCDGCNGQRLIERRIPQQTTDPVTLQVITTEVVEWLDCPQCNGTGAMRAPGNSEARKTLTEIAGLTGKKGPLVQQTFVNNYSMGNVVDDLADISDAPIIDVTANEV